MGAIRGGLESLTLIIEGEEVPLYHLNRIELLLKAPDLFLDMSINGSKLKLNESIEPTLGAGNIRRAYRVARPGVDVGGIGYEPCRSAKCLDAVGVGLCPLVQDIHAAST